MSEETKVPDHTLVSPKIVYLPENGRISTAAGANIDAQNSPNNPLECSIHTLPRPLLREFEHVFRQEMKQFAINDNNKNNMNSVADTPVLLAIPTNQMAKEDLVAIGDHIEAEKDRLLKVFMNFAEELTSKIKAHGYWADYIDPCSGLPMLSTYNHNKVYSEVDGMEVLLNYRSYSAGFCKILVHPKWGSSVYPATIFAYAPLGLVKNLLETY